MEKSITINEERCIGCGMCVKDCFMGCLVLDENKHPRYGENGEARCAGCQHCMAVCPKGALSFGGIDPDECTEVAMGNPDELLTLIKSRRSVRQFRKTEVPREQLEQIRDMLAYPPTGGNAPSLHIAIIGSRAKMEEIATLAYDEASKSNDPLLQFAAQHKEDDIIYRHAPAMIIVSVDPKTVVAGCDTVDPIIALSYAELYANSLGLGTLWDDMAMYIGKHSPAVSKAYGIPEGDEISFVLLLGVPSIRYKRTPKKEANHVQVIC